MNLYTAHFESPFGELITAVDAESRLVELILPNGHQRWQAAIARHQHTITLDEQRCEFVLSQLDEYFQGKRRTFDVALRLVGTDFQKQVWTALQNIPYGTTTSYGKLAEQFGKAAAVR